MSDSAAEKFQGIPIDEPIAELLKAKIDSQQQLESSVFEFITKIRDTDSNKQEPRPLTFELERPTQDSSVTSKINVPFLKLVPIPAILVEDVTIDFQMEVTDTATGKSTSASETTVDAEASNKFESFKGGGKVLMAGKVSSSRENTRSTNIHS